MARTGSIDDLIKAYIKTYNKDGAKAIVRKDSNNQSITLKDYEKTLSKLTSHLHQAASIGDVGLTLQIKNLGQARSWMSTPVETAYLEARQNSLKAGLKAYKKLQENTLSPPSGQNKKQGDNKPQGKA